MRQRIDAQREAERLVVEVGRLRSDGLRRGEEAKRELAQREQQGGAKFNNLCSLQGVATKLITIDRFDMPV